MRYALITGSTSGIGKAIGISLIREGYFVFFNYYSNEENVSKLKEELKYEYFQNRYSFIKLDLSEIENVDKLHKEVLKETDKIDILILNSATTDKSNFEDIKIENWNKVMDLNLSNPFFIVQKFSNMINDNGRIIFIGALLGKVPHAMSISYSVSKAGLHMLAKNLVKVFKHRGITSNVVAPGFIQTDWQTNKDPEHRKRIENKIALGRFGTSSEVAKTCLHIIDNQYINGAIIDVDGGYQMEWLNI